MTADGTISVLFTGYAPVHFACFRPIFERLSAVTNIDIRLSGGLRSRIPMDGASLAPEDEPDAPEPTPTQTIYDLHGMYGPFGIGPEHLLTVDEARQRDFDVLFAANTKMIMPRSARLKVQIFHGISFRNKAVRDENAGADYYFIVGPYMRRAFAQSGILPEGDPRALHIGFPKTDRLLNGELDRQAILRSLGFNGLRPVVLFAPTGQKKNALETMGEAVISNLAATNRYDIVVKPHDHPKNASINWQERLAPLLGPHTRLVREPDVIPLLLIADLLITDASSVSSEFALRDLPMVFIDVPELLAKVSAAGGSKVDLKTWGRRAGVLVETPDEIVAAVDSSLAYPHRYSEVRRSMGADLFYNPGRATDAAVHWFLNTCAPSLAAGAIPT